MSSLDSINSTSIQEASSGSALQIAYTTALFRNPFDLIGAWAAPAIGASAHFAEPSFQTFQITGPDSMVLGYSFDDLGLSSGHFVEVWDALSPIELRTKMLRMACHFLVDMVPPSGLDEMLEKAADIREYYCSLANWSTPALPETVPVAVNPVITSYERESFSYPEE
jgi:hypothetical protein